MMKIKHAVICAAGLGSRLGKNMPKTLVNITEDKKIIDHQLELVEEIELPDVRPIINFYGCSFNFAYDGCAESRYYNGSDIYNQRKEDS